MTENNDQVDFDAYVLQAHGFSWQEALRVLWPPVLISGICIATIQVHYLLFHTLAEFFSIVIALTALVVASTSRHFTRNHFTVFLSVAIGWCAALDMIHVVTYKGMPFVPSQDVGLATQFWVAARFIQALILLSSPLFLRRSVALNYLQAGMGLTVLGVSLWIFSGTFPVVFIEGQGLTPFKIYAEYVIIAMLLASGLLLWRQRSLMSPRLFLRIQAALVMMVLSEFAFTRYVSLYGELNTVGHIFKIFAYWFVYLALVQSTLREPFSMLSRTASTYDAVPDPAFVVRADGQIRQANQAAGRYAGMASQELVGCLMHPLFHAPGVAVQDCPVCTRMLRGESRFSAEIDRGGKLGVVECTVAPFIVEGSNRSYVQVVRDITERKRLAAERELLVHNLGERVKELRCLYDISRLIDQSDLDVPGLLAGVSSVLPSGFLLPEQARAAVVSDWGTFGSQSEALARRCLVRDVRVHGDIVGTLRVCYPDEVHVVGEIFLPEEQDLLETVAKRMGEAIERIQAQAQVRRLTYLYDMLSATNRAIVRCTHGRELLKHLFDALILHGAFPKLFIAITSDGALPLSIVHVHGIESGELPQLEAMLADPQSQQRVSQDELFKGQVVVMELDRGKKREGWNAYLLADGIHEQAILPLMREGRLYGLVGLYAQGPGAFDQTQLGLLNEMAADLAFALNGMAVNERRQAAEQRADLSELLFREVFESSPVPMMIESVGSRRMRAANRALLNWLGYGPEEIQTEGDWFNKVYPDPVVLREALENWPKDIAAARATGLAVHSPELRLRAKDGGERIAQGTMTIVGDDAIIAWTDLTDIRRSEQALRDSEAHFRNMIEQTVTGIYVRHDDRLIYVNPSYCEMVGWTSDELLGQDVWKFTPSDPQNMLRIREAWSRLEHGERSVHYNVPLLCKNGEIRELALHATRIEWNALPATIVMAEDITERKHAEEQIASYVRQLEASMRGTLQAVSNMIDLRDPYTAGHERRVGLLAGAIAAEMGWSARQCQELEMIGLVHDIGKIAVPAEILTKPGRLTPMEMQLVQVHAQAGYDILKDIPFSFPVAEVIRQHHERLDGSGYPRGLKGEEILQEARVLAVADVLESISAHRPYRPALGLDAALAELERGRSTQYDSDVIDAARRLLLDKGYSLPD
jgi:PAS domain S-box-containing protein